MIFSPRPLLFNVQKIDSAGYGQALSYWSLTFQKLFFWGRPIKDYFWGSLTLFFQRHWVSPMMMIMMMNCFCGMVDRRKAFSLISSWDHCQRSSPSWTSDTLWTGFEPVHNLSSGLVEWSCAVVITTTPRHHIVTTPRRHNFCFLFISTENFDILCD